MTRDWFTSLFTIASVSFMGLCLWAVGYDPSHGDPITLGEFFINGAGLLGMIVSAPFAVLLPSCYVAEGGAWLVERVRNRRVKGLVKRR